MFPSHRRFVLWLDRKSTRLNSSHTVIYTLSLHDALPISGKSEMARSPILISTGAILLTSIADVPKPPAFCPMARSEEHTSELQSHSDLHSFPTRRSSDLRQI